MAVSEFLRSLDPNYRKLKTDKEEKKRVAQAQQQLLEQLGLIPMVTAPPPLGSKQGFDFSSQALGIPPMTRTVPQFTIPEPLPESLFGSLVASELQGRQPITLPVPLQTPTGTIEVLTGQQEPFARTFLSQQAQQMFPDPGQQFLSVNEAASLGVPFGTTRQAAMAMGRTPPPPMQFVGTVPSTGEGLLFGRTGFRTEPIPGGQVGPKIAQPLPPSEQASLIGAINAFDDIKTIMNTLHITGPLNAIQNEAQARFSNNEFNPAVRFATANNNMLVAAQDIIKGIPSNFDVQNFRRTLPSFWVSPAVNKNRIDRLQKKMVLIVNGAISFYKGTGRQIPDYIIQQAKIRGVDVGSVKPWDGQSVIDVRLPDEPPPGAEMIGTTQDGKPVWKFPGVLEPVVEE